MTPVDIGNQSDARTLSGPLGVPSPGTPRLGRSRSLLLVPGGPFPSGGHTDLTYLSGPLYRCP